MRVPSMIARGTLRFSLGSDTTREEMDETAVVLTKVVHRLRSMSPLYMDMKKSKP
jgi:cysteine desulfurase